MQEIRGAVSPSSLFSPSGSNGDFFTTMWSEATKSLDTTRKSGEKKLATAMGFSTVFPLTWDFNCQINRVGVGVRGIMRYHEVWKWNWNSITNSGLMVVDELMVWLTSQRLGGIPSYPCCSSSGSGLPCFWKTFQWVSHVGFGMLKKTELFRFDVGGNSDYDLYHFVICWYTFYQCGQWFLKPWVPSGNLT